MTGMLQIIDRTGLPRGLYNHCRMALNTTRIDVHVGPYQTQSVRSFGSKVQAVFSVVVFRMDDVCFLNFVDLDFFTL
jgi:hypothetical protein